MDKIIIFLQYLFGYGYTELEIEGTILNTKGESPKIWKTYIPIPILMFLRRIEKQKKIKIKKIRLANSKTMADLFDLSFSMNLSNSRISNDYLICNIYEPTLINEHFSFNICKDLINSKIGKISKTLFFNIESEINA